MINFKNLRMAKITVVDNYFFISSLIPRQYENNIILFIFVIINWFKITIIKSTYKTDYGKTLLAITKILKRSKILLNKLLVSSL